MKFNSFFIALLFCVIGFCQSNNKITTIETVEILNNNSEEAIYYFENNWKVLRTMAVDKGYIDSFQLLQASYTNETPFHFILITTYTSKAQYEKRENHFGELIKAKGGLKLLNEKKPADFRKSVFSVDAARHLE